MPASRSLSAKEGNPGPAIPVLQQKLRDSRVAVPPRPTTLGKETVVPKRGL